MNHLDDSAEWGAAEQAEFAALPRAQMPPPALEEKIVHALKAKGLVQMKRALQRWTLPRVAGAVAAAALFAAIGFGLGKWQSQTPGSAAEQSLFVLFLYDGDAPPALEAEQVRAYGHWARQLSQAGNIITGEKLKYDGRVLRLAGNQLETSALAAEPRNVALGGYFLIAAKNLEEASRLAATCPHLKYGGTIALREIDPT